MCSLDGNDISANHNLVLLASDCSPLSAHWSSLSLSLSLHTSWSHFSCAAPQPHTHASAHACPYTTWGDTFGVPEGYRLHELQQTFTRCCFMLPFTCHTCTVTNPACIVINAAVNRCSASGLWHAAHCCTLLRSCLCGR